MLLNVMYVLLFIFTGVTISGACDEDLRDEVTKLKTQVADLAAIISKQGPDRFTRVLMADVTPSAFYAYISHNFGDIASNRILVYDTVVTDVGGEYDKYTGVFTANEKGVYAFSWVILVSGSGQVGGEYGEVAVEIIHNGQNRGSIHADSEVHNDNDSASGFVVLSLERGDHVFLRTTTYASHQGYFSSTAEGGRWSFSGFRIA